MTRAAARARPDVVTVTLPEGARARLDALSAAWGCNRSEVVRALLERADAADVPMPAPDRALAELRELVLAHEQRIERLERR